MRVSTSSKRPQRKPHTIIDDLLELALANTIAEENHSFREGRFLLDSGLDLVVNMHTQAMLGRALVNTRNKQTK
jgi:hypothetical protein